MRETSDEDRYGYCLACHTLVLPRDGSKCPQCGHSFDLERPDSFAEHERIPRFVGAFALRPLTWRYFGLLLLAVLVVLWDARMPNEWPVALSSRGVLLGLIPLGIFGFYLFIRALVGLHFGLALGPLFTKGPLRLLATPLLVTLTVLILKAELPSRAAFSYSKAILEREADAFRAQPFEPNYAGELPHRFYGQAQRIGAYWVEGMALVGGELRFYCQKTPVGLRRRLNRTTILINAQSGAEVQAAKRLDSDWWAW